MASSSSSQSWKYDVFLSFRGEDTRRNFTDHLYIALDDEGIFTYKDDVTLSRGESIGPTLQTAIEESQYAVIVFSKDYATSTWCLNELKHIMKCRDERKQTVVPIFYGVEPTEVRNQKGKYKEAFKKHEMENMKKVISWVQEALCDPRRWVYAPVEICQKYRDAVSEVESWRKALKDASNISGWETKQIANGHEGHGIKQIVDEISQSLKLVNSEGDESLVGMRTRAQALKSELQIESGGVRIIGIWGFGGGGKTTLASYIYDEISSLYDGCCFVDNIREESSKNGLGKLQENLLSGILKQKQGLKVWRVEEGRRMLKARLRHKKVLIVLDDVDGLDQLKALVGSHDWFGEGSRIIITTRDEHVLNAHRVDVTHHIRLLNHDESVKLFRKHAHGAYTPMEKFEQLSEEVVSYAGGLPLALTVLGCFLCDKNISQWRSALDRLKEIPDKDIIGKLRISFDGLEQVEKDLFLDIACFFRWELKDRAMERLHACGFYPVIGVEVLRQKALIVISKDGRFNMHDLVQEMGHYIVRGKHPKNPEEHTRVWKREDVERILAMDATTMKLDNIEAIDVVDVGYEESQRFFKVAVNMTKLRWIDLRCSEQFNEERDEIIILPLPENFPPTQLCWLNLRGGISQKQLWEGYKYLPNLTNMELKDLRNLIKIPDFSGVSNLETFGLYNCPCLEEIDPSIGRLERLVFVSIESCQRLRVFPSITQIKKLETLAFRYCDQLEIISSEGIEDNNLPDHRGLRFLHSALRKLDLSWCNLGDEEIGSHVWELPNLEQLDLSNSPLISRLDFSILRLPRLKRLNVSNCYSLVEMSELPSSIAVIIADWCYSLESIGDISNCRCLWNVSLWGDNQLGQLRVEELVHSMFQGNACEDRCISVAVRLEFPNEIIGGMYRRKEIGLQLPDSWYNDFCGFMICIVTNDSYPHININIMKQEEYSPPFDLSQEEEEECNDEEALVEPILYLGEMTCVGYISFSSLWDTTSTLLLTSSYNFISFEIETEHDTNYVTVQLVPRKSSNEVLQTTTTTTTTDSSEFFWDKQSHQDANSNTFMMQQRDLESSSIEVLWKPCLLHN